MTLANSARPLRCRSATGLKARQPFRASVAFTAGLCQPDQRPRPKAEIALAMVQHIAHSP